MSGNANANNFGTQTAKSLYFNCEQVRIEGGTKIHLDLLI
tara:strand:- start:7046 stop:7165 length:120 start_codon:yes stop_codon:yes gene_type:complete